MKTIALIRHASAGPTPPRGGDIDRPLDSRGRGEIVDLLDRFTQTEMTPQLVLCSPARRALETLEGIRGHSSLAGCTVLIEEGLYLASSSQLMERLHATDENVDSVVLIGHNPGIGMLAHELAQPYDEKREGPSLSGDFQTAALAILQFNAKDWWGIAQSRGVLTTMNAPT